MTIKAFPPIDQAFKELVPDFKKQHPNISLEIQKLGFGESFSSQMNHFFEFDNKSIDLITMEKYFLGGYDKTVPCVNLLKWPYRAQRYQKDLFSFAWHQGKVSPDKLIGIPVDIAPATAVWRVDKLSQSGIDYKEIQTLDDLYQAGLKFIKDTDGDGQNDQWMIGHAANIFEMILRSRPQRFFDSKGNPVLNRDDVALAMEWAKKFRDANLDAQIHDWSVDWFTALEEGKIAFLPTGSWMIKHLNDWIAPHETGKYQVGSLPALSNEDRGMYASWGGTFLCIPKHSKHKKEAWLFIEFLLQPDIQKKMFKSIEIFPSNKKAIDDEIINRSIKYLSDQKPYQVWIEDIKNIPDVSSNHNDSIAHSILMSACDKVFNNELSIKEALDEAQKDFLERVNKNVK